MNYAKVRKYIATMNIDELLEMRVQLDQLISKHDYVDGPEVRDEAIDCLHIVNDRIMHVGNNIVFGNQENHYG